MEVWGIIGQNHHRLLALAEKSRCNESDDRIAADLKHHLIAELEAEETAVWSRLRTKPGFKERIPRLASGDHTLRVLADDLDRASPRERIPIVEAIEHGLAEHIEEHGVMVPVAKKELPYHVWEHMKHVYELSKHSTLRRLTGAPEDVALAQSRGIMRDLESELQTSGKQDTQELLERVRVAEHKTLQACRSAIDRVGEVTHRSLLGEIAEDHLRAADELGALLSAETAGKKGRSRPSGIGGRLKTMLAIVGSDKAILKTIRSIEARGRSNYERMSVEQPAHGPVTRLLGHLAEEADEHCRNIESALAA